MKNYSSGKEKRGKNNFRFARKNSIIWLNKWFLNKPEVVGLFYMESLLKIAKLLFHLLDVINVNPVNSNNFLEYSRIMFYSLFFFLKLLVVQFILIAKKFFLTSSGISDL